jgi:hypothetical protein
MLMNQLDHAQGIPFWLPQKSVTVSILSIVRKFANYVAYDMATFFEML